MKPSAIEVEEMQKLNKWTQEELMAPDGVVCVRMPNGGTKGPFPDGHRITGIGLCGFDSNYHHDAVLVAEVICPLLELIKKFDNSNY